jgi:thymidine phosphorylase
LADRDGFLSFHSVREVGLAVAALGGGRLRIDDQIDPAVVLVWRRAAGEAVRAGETLCEIHHRSGHGLARCQSLLTNAVEILPAAAPGRLILDWLR